MLKYKLVESNNDLLTYHYNLAKDEKPGEVTINRTSGQAKVVKQSENDFGNRFAFKLLGRLIEFFKEGEFKEEGAIAWY